MKKKFTDFDSMLLILVICSALLIVPYATRLFSYNLTVIGEEPYYHSRIAREINEKGIPYSDEMIAGSRPYIFNLYHPMLAGFSFLSSIDFASKFLPYLFGILSLFLFYKILQKFNVDLSHKFAISLLLISSPIFIYTFTLSNPLAMAVFMILFGFYLFLRKSRISYMLSIIIFVLTVFLGFLNASITLLLVFCAFFIKPKEVSKKKLLLIFLILLLASLIFYVPIQLKYGFPGKVNFIQKNTLKTYISDLGGNGFAIFTLILVFVGLVTIWKNKYRFAIVYILIVILFLLSYNHQETLIYTNFIFSILAGYTLIDLIKKKWKLKLIKNITIFILILGIFFSTLSYLSRIEYSLPNRDIIESLEWLNQNSKEGEIVFSHYSRGFWIEAIAKRPVVMDSYFGYINANQRFNDSEQIFYSRNLDNTKSILDKYEVKYIWFNAEMKEGKVWTKEREGLLFLFRNNETFKNIYDNKGIEIWQYLKEE